MNPFATPLAEDGYGCAGWVAKDNLDDLAARVHEMLDGKEFAFTDAYEYRGFRPETRYPLTVQRVSVLSHGVQVSDGSYSWTLTGYRESQPPHGYPHHEDELRDGMFVEMNRKRMTVELRTPEGKRAWWHVLVTGTERER